MQQKRLPARIAFISCWCHLRVYALQAFHLRNHVQRELGSPIEVVSSNCGCFYTGVRTAASSLFTYRNLLIDQSAAFLRLPYVRLHEKPRASLLARNLYQRWAEPLRGYLYAKKTAEADIVHFHQCADSFGYGAFEQLLRFCGNKKIVVTLYGLSALQREQPWLNRIYNKASAVIVSTGFMKEKLAASGVEPGLIHVIPFGATLGGPGNRPRQGAIMFAGSPLIRAKGLEYLLPALGILKSRGRHIRLTLHGYHMRGHKEWADDLIAREGLEDLVSWKSFASEGELAEAYRSSACCVIPYSDYPGCFPASVAMANATPILANDGMGIPETVGDAGMVIHVRSVTDFAQALDRIFRDAELQRTMGDAGRRIAERTFTWPVVAKKTAAVYDEVLQEEFAPALEYAGPLYEKHSELVR